jgi:peptide chain release factor
MLIVISSGNGVDEVCRALWHFMEWIEGRFVFEVIRREYARCDRGYKSVVIRSDDTALLALQGTIVWRSSSPFRPRHKRKNWYFSLQVYEETGHHCIDESRVVYQTMKSPKKGGQHVNKTASGVRAIYPPLGIEAISYDERSQYRNKAIALKRLIAKVQADALTEEMRHKQVRWKEGRQIERGHASKIFAGERFVEVVVT